VELAGAYRSRASTETSIGNPWNEVFAARIKIAAVTA